MSDQYPFFAYLSRMRYINRWGLMRNTFQENIQEHSHMVAVLAHALAVIRRDVFGGNAEFKQAAEQTLEALQGYGLPELDYFLEHFLPAFGLTLDELQ